ncbi:MAG: 2-oxo acid dehydrogenase subunit E2 [Nitrospirae bacterium]|nr:2-oxo acid dehydrogenase subunit E2 [Nitrospirota bacterium]
MADFLMPTLGADMTTGTLITWRKKVGDQVTKGEILAEIDTEKAAIEIESFHTGVIEQLLTKPGDTVAVGTVMAIIREEGTRSGQVEAEVEAQVKGERKEQPAAPPPPQPRPPAEGERVRISPAAKKLAAELGVDLSTVHGTGPDGAISLEDIERSTQTMGYRRETSGTEARPPIAQSPSPIASAADAAADKQARMRQTIAAAMTRSKREIPHYYLSTTIDMGTAMAWLTEDNLRRPVTDRLLVGVLLLKAVALALREVPELNAVWKGSDVIQSPDIHVGVAISLRGGGLVAPALHQTDRQPLGKLMKNFQDLVKRARAGALRGSELSDPTITVTSLGEQGVETVFGVIYPPQVALVGLGKLVERPWVVNGQVVARPLITASLSADHRVTDGHRGGLFLAALDRLLQEPGKL